MHTCIQKRARVHAHTLSSNLLWQQSVTPWVVTCPAALSQICKHKHRAEPPLTPPPLFLTSLNALYHSWVEMIKKKKNKSKAWIQHLSCSRMLDVVEIKYIEKRCSQQFRRKWFLDGLHPKCTITFTGERHVISDICNILHNCSVCQCLVHNRLVTWQAIEPITFLFWCFIYHQCGSPLCLTWTNDNRLHSLQA